MTRYYYRWLKSVMRHYRAKRFQEFRRLVPISPQDKILDVGGSPYFWEGSGLEAQVTLLNITMPATRVGPYCWIQGDACRMDEFADRAFDLAFSNSVIEHVGDFQRQQQMAQEIRRVASRYWVQTPNRHFPLEPHFMFPFFQYMPLRLKYAIARRWPFSHGWHNKRPTAEVATIRLLTRAELRQLFPEAVILRETVCGLTKSFTAYSI